MTNKQLQRLTKDEIKVAAKTMMENGYTTRQVEEVLNIDHSSAALYAKMPTPEELSEFSTIFDNYIKQNKQKGIVLVYNRLLELLPKERRIDQVVKAGEYLEGKNIQQTLNQINIGGELGVQFEKA